MEKRNHLSSEKITKTSLYKPAYCTTKPQVAWLLKQFRLILSK